MFINDQHIMSFTFDIDVTTTCIIQGISHGICIMQFPNKQMEVTYWISALGVVMETDITMYVSMTPRCISW